MASAKNLYQRRLVAESGSKPCWVCYRPSSTVLITSEPDATGAHDWFHICPGHLTDRKFAIPKDEEDQAEKARKEALEKEIELVKKEYEEKIAAKLKKKEKKDAEKDGKKDGKKEDKGSQKEGKEIEDAEKEKEAKLKELEARKSPEKARIEGPRIFELHKNFWQMRMQKKRDAEIAKRNRERMRNPGFFPSAPSGDLA